MKRLLGYLLFAAVSVFLADCLFTIAHENAHAVIYEHYGIESTIDINIFGTSYTIPNATKVASLYYENPEAYYNLRLANDMVDAYGYQLEVVLLWVVFFLSLISTMLVDLLAEE